MNPIKISKSPNKSKTKFKKNFYVNLLKNDSINKNYYKQALKYQKANPFEKFNQNKTNNIKLIMENIDRALINELNNVLYDNVALDITFCNILVLIGYTTYKCTFITT